LLDIGRESNLEYDHKNPKSEALETLVFPLLFKLISEVNYVDDHQTCSFISTFILHMNEVVNCKYCHFVQYEMEKIDETK
jgi:hypothetical protein